MEKNTSKNKQNRLKDFSISFLAILLGFVGFSLTYLKAEHTLNLPFKLSGYLFYFTIILFIVISTMYIAKWIKYPAEVKKEIKNPIKINFFPILAKFFLISSIFLISSNFIASKFMWWIGVILQLGFTLFIMSTWIQHPKYQIKHINPSLFIPIVGSILVPIVGIQHFSKELSWFFFSIGLIWWLTFFIIVMNRVIFHDPIGEKLIPTFFILFAPPAIGFISLVKLLGEITPFAKILYYFGLFMFILIMFQFNMFKKIKFYLSWWAYSFPIAALTLATILMYEETKLVFFHYLTWGLFILLNFVMILLTIKTIKAIIKKDICIEEVD